MSDKKKVLFIINPISGAKKRIPLDQLIDRYLDKNRYEPKIHFTTARGDAISQSHKAVDEGVDMVVAVGGDGTINEVAQGLVNTGIPLGIIPRGSGNGFANYLNIPHDPGKAMALINQAQSRAVDTGTFNGKLFLSVAGLGFDARVSAAFDVFGKRGLLSYMYISAREYFRFQPKTYRIDMNGSTVETKAFLLTMANSSQFGNNAFIAPNALIDDGLLDVVVLKPAGLFGAIGVSIRMFMGTLDKSPYCETYQANNLTITHQDREAQIDGEPVLVEKETLIKVQPRSLQVVS